MSNRPPTDPAGVEPGSEGAAFLIEWQGKQLHALSVLKRGRVFYRTADDRLLGRAAALDVLIPSRQTLSGPDQPAKAAAEMEPSAAATPVASSHWADDLPTTATTLTPGPCDDVADEPTSAVPSSETAADDEHGNDPGLEGEVPLVTFNGTAWNGTALDGTATTVWNGTPTDDDIAEAIADLRHEIRQLEQLRRAVHAAPAPAVLDRMRRLAAADGVTDLAEATADQLSTWRRYAEAIPGS